MNKKEQLLSNVKTLALKALSKGKTQKEVAEMYGVDRTTILRWTKREDLKLLDRKQGTGRKTKLGRLHIEWIIELIKGKATKFGFETDLWTSPRIQKVFNKKNNLNISLDTIQRFLNKAGFTDRKPEKRYYQDDKFKRLKQEWFKKEKSKIFKFAKEKRAVIYYEDEANINLLHVLEANPSHEITKNFSSVSTISVISSGGNLLFKLYDKKITSVEIIDFFEQLLIQHRRRNLVLVMDNANLPISDKVNKFLIKHERLHVFSNF
jgi:transposase